MSFSTGKVIASIALSLACSAAVRGGEVSYSVQTVAGSSVVGDGSAAVNAQLSDAQCLAVDRSGNVYIADPDNHRVRRVNPQGIIQTVAGQGYPGFSGDGGPASQARLNAPYGLATDAAGALYIADLGNNRVRKVTPDGVITTVAGTGQAASGGDGSKAPEAQLNGPRNVAVDSAGNLYISEFMGHRIRLVTADGMIWTLAGTGVAGTRGEEIAATLSELAYPAGLYLDFTGTLFIADSGNKRIRAVYNGVMRTLPVPGAELILPTGVASDAAGGLYIADGGSHRLYRRLFSGAVLPVAGAMTLESAREAISDGRGNLLIADGHRVRLLTAAGGTAIFAGDGSFGYRGDGAAATASVLNGPSGVAVDRDGNLFIADTRNHRIRKISSSGVISTFAGTGQPAASPEGLPPLSTALVAPGGLLADPSGGLWISESFGARVRRLTPAGSILTVAGNGTAGFGGDSRQAIGAQLQNPGQTALDAAGNLYIADTGNNRIRRVINGIISTFAGNGTGGFAGDGGQAVSAQLSQPRGIAFDSAGNLYIADTGNHRIRKVNPGGLITTVAGDGNIPLTLPRAVAVDSAQNLYIADTANHRIVKIAPGAAPA
ncbi:MAG TPA: NHL repeat-containing protein, partial [Bryobacteraceae bacterium]|nr:NHL repeat-containing protein [Bryobacteraceae bacterium]